MRKAGPSPASRLVAVSCRTALANRSITIASPKLARKATNKTRLEPLKTCLQGTGLAPERWGCAAATLIHKEKLGKNLNSVQKRLRHEVFGSNSDRRGDRSSDRLRDRPSYPRSSCNIHNCGSRGDARPRLHRGSNLRPEVR